LAKQPSPKVKGKRRSFRSDSFSLPRAKRRERRGGNDAREQVIGEPDGRLDANAKASGIRSRKCLSAAKKCCSCAGWCRGRKSRSSGIFRFQPWRRRTRASANSLVEALPPKSAVRIPSCFRMTSMALRSCPERSCRSKPSSRFLTLSATAKAFNRVSRWFRLPRAFPKCSIHRRRQYTQGCRSSQPDQSGRACLSPGLSGR
jgi:hypothetical protein